MLKLSELKLSEFLKGFKSGLSDIRNRISKYNAQEREYETERSKDGDEMQQAHLHPEIAAGVADGEAQLLGLANFLEPGRDLIFQRTGDLQRDFTKLINVLHFLLADIEKKKIKELFEAKWPKNAITTEERQRKLREIRAARSQLEREEEQMIAELETSGVNVPRRGDENPEIFLAWNGKDFDRAKLEDFHSASLAMQAAATEVSHAIAAVVMQRREFESCLQRVTLKSDEERFQKELDRLHQEQQRLTAKRAELEKNYEPTRALYNRCSEFLSKQGVQI
jgi:hypothetical protein